MRTLICIVAAGLVLTCFGASALAQKPTIHESPHKRLSRACDKCHVATSFKDIRFDHDETGFELSGRHADVACLLCHNIEDFSEVESTCGTCHEDIHRGRLGASCELCHATEGWRVFDADDIHARTNFPLMGRHILLDCESCHPGMPATDFRQAHSQCIDCHRADYDRVTTPDHRASGFATDCESCHEMVSWTPARFLEHEAIFPIFSGSHRGVWNACAQCHIGPVSQGNVTCIDCHDHRQDAMDAFHQGFPGYAYDSQSCLGCHPRGEAGRFVEHEPFFPIFSGKHAGRWNSCAQCHEDPQSRQVFTCLSCHEHSQSRMDDKHLGEVNGYIYTSTACYDCHPRGTKE